MVQHPVVHTVVASEGEEEYVTLGSSVSYLVTVSWGGGARVEEDDEG